eukprot:CAMPEP_0185577716 /NCGR_PEP_ID=MMETSP0434-20130131/10821_1 /TAXON_ID=626734 ORGANISM="Favella taraikaensis, Strain Fe Narragansett Bay" /NCGR_SAMPLE_ID=MMETSP0434 /ASSEMBLY_ACC=CAM_ASM_000379 /LENGTH=83 /DNA_ID=CAMNT_0028195355 /DNA_START=497 /DNA_END=744 /DNA_ORIENTATION=-
MDLRFDVGDDLALQLFNFFGIRVAAHQAEQLHVVFEDHVFEVVAFLIVDELLCEELLHEDETIFKELVVADAARAIHFCHYFS